MIYSSVGRVGADPLHIGYSKLSYMNISGLEVAQRLQLCLQGNVNENEMKFELLLLYSHKWTNRTVFMFPLAYC